MYSKYKIVKKIYFLKFVAGFPNFVVTLPQLWSVVDMQIARVGS